MARRKLTFTLILVIALIASVVGLRLWLPYGVENYINEKISEIPDHGGSVKDVDINLWRGAYVIEDLEIYKLNNGVEEPFVAAQKIDLSVEWKALLDGAIVAEVDLYNIDITFANNQTGEGGGWLTFVNALTPLSINRLEVHNSQLHYVNRTTTPNVDLFIRDIDGKVTNLRQTDNSLPSNSERFSDDDPSSSNDRDSNEQQRLPSTLDVTGNSIGGGILSLQGNLNILKSVPDFDLQFELRDAQIPAFNDYTRAFSGIDFNSGTLGIYAEVAAADGHLVGYVKPVARKVDIVDLNEEKGPLELIWESLAALFVEIFQNQSKDQFALRVPIEGNIDNPDQDMWSAFFSIFQNAFGQAFSRNPDGSINFKDALEKPAAAEKTRR